MNAYKHHVFHSIIFVYVILFWLYPDARSANGQSTVGFLAPHTLQCSKSSSRVYSVPISTEEDVRKTYTVQLEESKGALKGQAPLRGSRYYILAIETSCDDSCAAVISSDGEIVSEERASNPESLIKFGGIKPDESYRFHVENIGTIIERVVKRAGISYEDLGRIAVTRGPGMRICLKAGYDIAEQLSQKYGIPLIGENHLAGHCISPLIKGHQMKITHSSDATMSNELKYPFLSLLLSGGHSQIYVVEGPAKFHMLVDTMDHYAGNVLYKCAKELDLPIDNGGGPSIEEAARKKQGASMFSLTEPCKDMSFTSFCFSGIQTQLREILIKLRQEQGPNVLTENPNVLYHLAHACQEVTFKQILRQLGKALDICETLFGIHQVVVVGGVSCNQRLRHLIAEMLHKREKTVSKREKALIARIYSHVKKAGPLRRFDRKDAKDNILIQNLVDKMESVKDLSGFLRLLWNQDLYPDLLQRREGIHLSVQQKNALYSALIQAYLSLLNETQVCNLHDKLQNRIRLGKAVPQPSLSILSELSQLELEHRSKLITRYIEIDREEPYKWDLFTTSPKYCTDNAVMIGYSLLEKHRAGMDGLKHGSFDEPVTDKWNLSYRRHWELLSDIAHIHALTEEG
ncbi:tRNA threonylcarbamoyladenosine modification protein [Babesia ovis]|uniref:N(6)-L-threonylcarbamoyladenine synthase n=1 Tax=Babesia ovis TaxID=5869 RepID=A0A9W5WU49_BABOV|nr:tRNA threonylcarbamoyladenosine modification protein [Babesia ovis]